MEKTNWGARDLQAVPPGKNPRMRRTESLRLNGYGLLGAILRLGLTVVLCGVCGCAGTSSNSANLPCWAKSEACQAKPGNLYFLGVAKQNPNFSESSNLHGAELLAVGQLSLALKTRVFATEKLSRQCARRGLSTEVCTESYSRKLRLDTSALMEAGVYEVADRYVDGNAGCYVRIAVTEKDFNRKVREAREGLDLPF